MFSIAATDIRYRGTGLNRPECIIAEPDGTLWVSEKGAAVTRIDPDGRQTRLGDIGGDPNGLAMSRDGELFIANIGDGRIYQLDRSGRHRVELDSIDGKPLGAVNFVLFDDQERLWATVSTRTEPRSEGLKMRRPDGYILLRNEHGWRIVADGLHFANELRFDASGRFLFVAETSLGRVIRIPLDEQGMPLDGSQGRTSYGPDPLLPGALVDGITFDATGNLWVTELSRNALIVIAPDESASIVFEDPEGTVLRMPTSLTFAGVDLKTAYVGSLTMDRLAVFESPVAGRPLSHWRG